MGLKEKVETALKGAITAARIRLEDDHGISGFVVSSDFRGMSALDPTNSDRQGTSQFLG